MIFQQTISFPPFNQWLWKDKENKRMYWFAMIAMTISFTWLKWLYPYPNFMPPDSYNYLEAAYRNDFINIWAIGYSKFLQVLGFFSHSHLVLVIVQYILLQVSLLYFLLTLRYLVNPGKGLFRIIVAASLLNPLLPHIANFVSSDCLFTTLSLVWCTQLLWIIYHPIRSLVLAHAIVLMLAFMVRYNALFYPFISAVFIIISSLPKCNKWLGLATLSILLMAFISRTQYEYHKKTGTVQYAAFGGWQMAANALYGYAHSKLDSPQTVPFKYQELHKLVNVHMDSLNHLALRPDREVGIYYLWDFKSPLRVFMEQRWQRDSTASFFKKWATIAPLYAGYGRYLIMQHPGLFLKYYAWPNLQRYYAPPSYFMGIYNMGGTTVEPIAVKWFGWKSNRLITHTGDTTIPLADAFTIIVPIINLIFVTGLLAFIGLTGFRQCHKASKQIIGCILTIWIGNMAFSVLSAPIELRYQLFPLIISLVWSIFFVTYIIQTIYTRPFKEKISQQQLMAK